MFDTEFHPQTGWIRMQTKAEVVTTEAIERAGSNADPVWRKAAEAAVYRVCKRQEFFTTDQIWAELGEQTEGVRTHEPRALGAVMRWAAQRKYCEPTSTVEKTKRIEAHRRPVAIWRSLIWDEVA